MKKITLAAGVAILCGNAYAATQVLNAATIPNSAGGEIMITEVPCPAGSGLEVLSTTANEFILQRGCAVSLDDSRVVVQWSDNTLSVFPKAPFVRKPIFIRDE